MLSTRARAYARGDIECPRTNPVSLSNRQKPSLLAIIFAVPVSLSNGEKNQGDVWLRSLATSLAVTSDCTPKRAVT